MEEERNKEKKVVKEEKRENNFNIKQFLFTSFFFLLVLGGYHYYLINYTIPRIKVFDLLGNLGVIQNLYVSGKMDETDLQAVLNELKEFLAKEGMQKNVYILPSQVVLNKDSIGELKFESAKLDIIMKSQGTQNLSGFMENMTQTQRK